MDAMKDLRAFILIILVLAFVWLFTGGPLRPSSKSGWFLNKPQQKAAQETKKQTGEILGTKSSVSSKEAAQNFSSKQSSSASSPLPYFRGDDGRPQPSSSSGLGVSYGDEKINKACLPDRQARSSLISQPLKQEEPKKQSPMKNTWK